MSINLLCGFIGLAIGVIFMALAWMHWANEKKDYINSLDKKYDREIRSLEERHDRQERELAQQVSDYSRLKKQLGECEFMISTYRNAYDYPAHGHVVYNGLEYTVVGLYSNEPTGDEPHDRAFVWNIMCLIWEHDYSERAYEVPSIDEWCNDLVADATRDF